MSHEVHKNEPNWGEKIQTNCESYVAWVVKTFFDLSLFLQFFSGDLLIALIPINLYVFLFILSPLLILVYVKQISFVRVRECILVKLSQIWRSLVKL